MKISLCVFLAVGILACFPVAAKADGYAGSPPDLRSGFFLIHEVCQRESQAHLIVLFKTTPPDIAAYIKKISQTADDSLKTLDRLQKGDSSLQADHNPLPPFEQATRKSIRTGKEYELLFGTKGPAYVKALLFDQIEGANYVMHLTKVWAQRDHNAERAATMRKISAQWKAIRDEGTRLLS